MTKHSLVYFLCMLVSIAVFAQEPTKPVEAKVSKTTQATPAKPVQVVTPTAPNATPATTPLEIQTKDAVVAPSSMSIGVPTPTGVNSEGAMAPTTVEWSELEVDFGEIKQGEIASHVFYVKNTGNVPLKITRVKPSCGCTTPNWTKDEILPGKAGEIELAFDSTGKSGIQRKTVTVFYNTEKQAQILRFNGEIVQ